MSRPHRVLVVDDDPNVRCMLEQMLQVEGHIVEQAIDGAEAIEAVRAAAPDMVIVDLEMPRATGFEVCRFIKSDPRTRLIPVVIVTGRTESEARIRAWTLGADDFLAKPYSPLEVLARCRSLLRVKELNDQLDSAQSVVFALARAIEAKSPFTQGHTERVTTHALAMAEKLGLTDSERSAIRIGSLLHDIGKIAIPDAILNKPGPLTSEEFAVIKQHPIVGARIVEPLRSVQHAIPMIRWHHERMDGKGYPDGLFAAAIPLSARLLSVADCYDALASNRPYRPALQHPDCLRIMRESAAKGGLDPELVECFAGICVGHSVETTPASA